MDKYPQSSRHLPYHLLVSDPWKYLEPEICEKTFARLLPLAKALGLAADDILKNVVNVFITQIVCLQYS
jgi:hypothetical protein